MFISKGARAVGFCLAFKYLPLITAVRKDLDGAVRTSSTCHRAYSDVKAEYLGGVQHNAAAIPLSDADRVIIDTVLGDRIARCIGACNSYTIQVMSDDVVGANDIIGQPVFDPDTRTLIPPILSRSRIAPNNVASDGVIRPPITKIDPLAIFADQITLAYRAFTDPSIAANRVIGTTTKRDPRTREIDNLQPPDDISTGVDFQPIDPFT